MDFVPDNYNDLAVKLRKEECTSKVGFRKNNRRKT